MLPVTRNFADVQASYLEIYCMFQEQRIPFKLQVISFWNNLGLYIQRAWNVIRVLALSLFVLGLLIGNLPFNTESWLDLDTIARVMLIISTILFYFMVLHFLEKSYVFGPKIVMVIEMVCLYIKEWESIEIYSFRISLILNNLEGLKFFIYHFPFEDALRVRDLFSIIGFKQNSAVKTCDLYKSKGVADKNICEDNSCLPSKP